MSDTTSDLRVEVALLRAGLWLTARALKTYHDAPHRKVDDEGVEKLQLVVPESARVKAGEALDRATKMLAVPARERGR